MLVYYQAREFMKDGVATGLYHYTAVYTDTGAIGPVGYCAQDCAGHDTTEAAVAHFRQWLIDHMRLTARFGIHRPCAVADCQDMTGSGATLPDGCRVPLCAAHRCPAGLKTALDLIMRA